MSIIMGVIFVASILYYFYLMARLLDVREVERHEKSIQASQIKKTTTEI